MFARKKMDLIRYELTKELVGFNGCTDVVIRPGPPAGQNTQKKHKTLRLSAAKSYGSFFFFSSFIINMPILNSNAQSDRDLVLQYMLIYISSPVSSEDLHKQSS